MKLTCSFPLRQELLSVAIEMIIVPRVLGFWIVQTRTLNFPKSRTFTKTENVRISFFFCFLFFGTTEL